MSADAAPPALRAAAAWGLARSMAIYYGQPWKAARMRRFYGQFISSGDLCFDVGAHVGNRIRAWRGLGARVIAVEPQPQMVALLRRLYGGQAEVQIEPVGLSDAPGQLTLRINTRNPTLTTFSEEWVEGFTSNPDIPAAPWDDSASVAVETLDALVERHGVPRFCKIDVEGFEDRVLAGLGAPIPALSFEAFPLETERSIRCVERLAALGAYRFRTVLAERFRWVEPEWLGAGAMIERLRGWSLAEGSGDVYAQLG